MKKYKNIFYLILVLCFVFLSTACVEDNMDNIHIVVTNYPNEYITKKLYANHATITSIYPDGVDINNYKISKKQKQDYSKSDLFIYNGLLEKERALAVDLLSLNPDLKIIDTAYVLETKYSPEELWLNPSSLLMMAQNVRLGLEEYITNNYLKKEIDEDYEKLKVSLSELDANYRVAVENTDRKKIVVTNSSLKYLENFGIKVICLDQEATAKTISDVQEAIDEEEISYFYSYKGETLNQNAQRLMEENPSIKQLKLHPLNNISDEERSTDKTYINIMNENFDLIKQELYQ